MSNFPINNTKPIDFTYRDSLPEKEAFIDCYEKIRSDVAICPWHQMFNRQHDKDFISMTIINIDKLAEDSTIVMIPIVFAHRLGSPDFFLFSREEDDCMTAYSDIKTLPAIRQKDEREKFETLEKAGIEPATNIFPLYTKEVDCTDEEIIEVGFSCSDILLFAPCATKLNALLRIAEIYRDARKKPTLRRVDI